MIELQNFAIGYGQEPLLDNIKAEFHQGQVTALIGRNGAGKSTLLRAMAGLNQTYTGDIIIDNKNIKTLTPAAIARRISFVTTQRVRIAGMCCRDVVAMGRAPYTNWIGNLLASDRAIINESLHMVGMTDYADRRMDRMSDGECQRIMIARALAQDTPVILLDEPTSFLDMPSRYVIAGLLHDLAHDQNKCIIYSTHELDIAMRQCDTIALIDSPNLLHLTPDAMTEGGHIKRLFHIPAPN